MARVPPKSREELSPEQQETHDMFAKTCHKAYGSNGGLFTYEESNGALIGPFPFFIHNPKVGKSLLGLLGAMQELPLPPDARETAIITTAAHYGGTYVGYSHLPQAVNFGYLTAGQAAILKTGSKPEGLNEECDIAFEVAKSLSGDSRSRPMPQDLWDRAVQILGKDAVVGLLQYIGFYSYVCVAMNGYNAPIPG